MKVRFGPLLQGTGILLIAYGTIREAFGDVAATRPVTELRGSDPMMQIISQGEDFITRFGGKMGMLPTQYLLTASEKRLNASLAIAGFLLLVVAALIATISKARGN